MQAHQLERWTLDIVERVRLGQPTEDSRVELKREWPIDMNKAARRLAGHCNASHGDLALWLIGIDESDGVVGAAHEHTQDWYAQLKTQFSDHFAPDLEHDLNVPYDGKTVVALLFQSDRAPYLVKVAGGGKVSLEVPWRQGTSVHTARRHELIKLLSPLQDQPEVELRSASLFVDRERTDVFGIAWRAMVKLYIIPPSSDAIIVLFHRCTASASIHGIADMSSASTISLARQYVKVNSFIPRYDKRPVSDHGSVTTTATEAIIESPCPVEFEASGWWCDSSFDVESARQSGTNATIRIGLHLARIGACSPIVAKLSPAKEHDKTVEWSSEMYEFGNALHKSKILESKPKDTGSPSSRAERPPCH